MKVIEPVTLSEAQFLLGRPEKELNRAIDRGEIDKIWEKVTQLEGKQGLTTVKDRSSKRKLREVVSLEVSSGAQKTVRKLGPSELLFLEIEGQVHDDLTPSGRKKLYNAIKSSFASSKTITFGPFEADIAKALRALKARYKQLNDVRKCVVENDGQDPVLKGTEISAYRIAALAQGQSVSEIIEDYPSLTAEQVKLAIDYATAYPKTGRPYPKRSFKRSVSSLADLGAFAPSDGEHKE